MLSAYEDLAKTIDDRAKLGMFYVWYGIFLAFRDRGEDSYKYLLNALKLGEEIGDEHLTGYACTWLTWTCADLGLLDEAISFGETNSSISNPWEEWATHIITRGIAKRQLRQEELF